MDVWDALPSLLLIAVVLHLHCHLAGEVILQRVLATVGVVAVQAESAPVLVPTSVESAVDSMRAERGAHVGVHEHDVVFEGNLNDAPQHHDVKSKGVVHCSKT